ncbi:MAG: hypothetical protein JWO03_1635 [Bacteroidetes bacterium]|nr:hypothetical protein [Bacteroidota bacterium]
MKYINTILLVVIAIALGGNFYLDHKRDVAIQAKAEAAAAPKKEDEPSPFDKMPTDPMHDPHAMRSGPVTTISFEKTVHDFGRIESGPLYKTSFKFTNTGKYELIVSGAKTSCGCTVPSFLSKPVKPGETGDIFVEFDSKGRTGQQVKLITVTTNTDPKENVLTIKSNPYVKN